MNKILSIITIGAILLFSNSAFAVSDTLYQVPNSSTAISDQDQGQIQGQGQELINSGNSAVVFENSFNGSDPVRSMPIPTNATVDLRGGPAMFSRPEPDKGPNFISMRDLLYVLNRAAIDMDAAEEAEDIEMVVQKMNEAEVDSLDTEEAINFSLIGPNGAYTAGFIPLAVITLKSEDEVNSVVLAAALKARARELGGNKIVFIREGVFRELSSWGVGIGAAYNIAGVSSDAYGQSQVGSGGTGWSWGKANYLSHPYLTAVVGR